MQTDSLPTSSAPCKSHPTNNNQCREPNATTMITSAPNGPLGPSKDGPSTPRRHRRKDRDTKNGFESVQDVIFQSMKETQQMNSKSGGVMDSNVSVFFDTIKDLQIVASGTIATIKEWTQQNSEDPEPDTSSVSILPQRKTADDVDREHNNVRLERYGAVPKTQAPMWPFPVCWVDVQARLPERDNIAPHIHKVKEVVSKAVRGDLNNAASDIWKFAAASKDDDDNTVGTLDTLHEENNQIRRLGSWGTVNTACTGGTGGTGDTGFNSFEPGPTPDEIQINMEDDDGNIIDPVLLQKAQLTREKRTPRREKIVKFDYPPIKSLRQCPRPDPEDLPHLFFTEHELDQIEDDRYSTMSTDDIEIVAVSSKDETQSAKSKFNSYKSPRAKQRAHASIDESPLTEHSPLDARDQPETGLKHTGGRTPTPYRGRREEDDDEADFPSNPSKSPSNNGRLVKGVQIYLRERSTGT